MDFTPNADSSKQLLDPLFLDAVTVRIGIVLVTKGGLYLEMLDRWHVLSTGTDIAIKNTWYSSP